eukprot:SAG31_NODE_1227_length_9239_cov_29.041904_1_plen_524_part_10
MLILRSGRAELLVRSRTPQSDHRQTESKLVWSGAPELDSRGRTKNHIHEDLVRRQLLQLAFNKFDGDGDGELDQGEVIQMMNELGYNLSEKATAGLVQELFEEHDTDGNGFIEFEEFEGIFEGLTVALRAGSNSMLLQPTSGQWDQARPKTKKPELTLSRGLTAAEAAGQSTSIAVTSSTARTRSTRDAPDTDIWEEQHDPASGQPYYVNSITNESVWERPSAAMGAQGQTQALAVPSDAGRPSAIVKQDITAADETIKSLLYGDQSLVKKDAASMQARQEQKSRITADASAEQAREVRSTAQLAVTSEEALHQLLYPPTAQEATMTHAPMATEQGSDSMRFVTGEQTERMQGFSTHETHILQNTQPATNTGLSTQPEMQAGLQTLPTSANAAPVDGLPVGEPPPMQPGMTAGGPPPMQPEMQAGPQTLPTSANAAPVDGLPVGGPPPMQPGMTAGGPPPMQPEMQAGPQTLPTSANAAPVDGLPVGGPPPMQPGMTAGGPPPMQPEMQAGPQTLPTSANAAPV